MACSPKPDSNVGLSMSHKLNYEAAALPSQPPQLDVLQTGLVSFQKLFPLVRSKANLLNTKDTKIPFIKRS